MRLKGWQMFGLDALQQAALQKILSYLDAAWAAGATTFPKIPQWMFTAFDKYQAEDLLATLEYSWDTGGEPTGNLLFRGFQGSTAAAIAESASKAFSEERIGSNYVIPSMFDAGEQGAWYDPSDWTTLWQDPDGLRPVTGVGQSVAIILDKRKGLARARHVMPASRTATLDAGVTHTGNGWRWNGAAINSKAALTPVYTIDNAMFYEVVFTVSDYVEGSVRIRVFGNGETATVYPTGVTGNGTYRVLTDPHGGAPTNQAIYIEGLGASNTFTVSNVTIQELPGNHAWQTGSTAFPTLQQDSGGKFYLSFDGVNDGLQSQALAGLTLDYPLDVACAVRANGDTLGGAFGVWGGAPPYYEIQKSVTANQWRAFVRGAVNANNAETVGTNSTAHVAFARFTATDVNLRLDKQDSSAATAQSNVFGTVSEIRIGNGGGGFFGGRFYGGVVRFGTLSNAQRAIVEGTLGSRAGLSL